MDLDICRETLGYCQDLSDEWKKQRALSTKTVAYLGLSNETVLNDSLTGFVFDGDAAIEAPRSLVKSLVPFEGICFVGGQSGSGKTFVVCYLAVSLASGE